MVDLPVRVVLSGGAEIACVEGPERGGTRRCHGVGEERRAIKLSGPYDATRELKKEVDSGSEGVSSAEQRD